MAKQSGWVLESRSVFPKRDGTTLHCIDYVESASMDGSGLHSCTDPTDAKRFASKALANAFRKSLHPHHQRRVTVLSFEDAIDGHSARVRGGMIKRAFNEARP